MESDRKKIESIFCKKGFFENLKPFAGAVRVMHKLLSLDYNIFICTSPLILNPYCLSEKYSCILKHFGEEFKKRLITVSDKTLIRGDILIDDKPIPSGLYQPSWNHIIFDQPYNRHIDGVPRIINWQDGKYLDTIKQVLKHRLVANIAGRI